MPENTTEQKAEYEEWLKQHPNETDSAKTLRGIIDDDIAEEKAKEQKRASWSREYNAKSITPKRKPGLTETE